MIIGAHAVIYSSSPEADRAFFRDVLGLPSVDAGEGWLIFGLPSAEAAFHPAEESGAQELYLLCDNMDTFLQDMAAKEVACSPVQSLSWGRLTRILLPGGGRLGVYQPRHARPGPASTGKAQSDQEVT